MICHVTVRTARLAESVEFYQWLLNLPIASAIKYPDTEIVFLGDGETKFELISDTSAELINAEGLTVGFTVDDLARKLKMLDEKGISHTDVISPQPGVRFAFFKDLNGCHIQLVEEPDK